MAKLANKRIYVIKERASRECHAEKNTDLCSVRENKDIQYRESKLFIAIYKLTCASLSVFTRFGRDFHYRE